MPRIVPIFMITLMLLQTASAESDNSLSGESLLAAKRALQQMTRAHGGMASWRQLQSMQAQRVHQSINMEKPFRFSLWGHYPSERIAQIWQDPSGRVVWDGEFAWSADWPLAQSIMPRYVMSVGFYLVNLPWYAQGSWAQVLAYEQNAVMREADQQTYVAVTLGFEPPMVRKPVGYQGPRDQLVVYIDPKTYHMAGVLQRRTHAGQLDASNQPLEVQRLESLFVPDSEVSVNGLVFPGKYSVYNLAGEKIVFGEFFDYSANVPAQPDWFDPAVGSKVVFDHSSAIQRRGVVSTDAGR